MLLSLLVCTEAEGFLYHGGIYLWHPNPMIQKKTRPYVT